MAFMVLTPNSSLLGVYFRMLSEEGHFLSQGWGREWGVRRSRINKLIFLLLTFAFGMPMDDHSFL